MKEKKYYELYKLIKKRILNGEYAAGEKLPSKRVAADMAGCSTLTVAAAYGMLEDEGYIYSRERSGYFVCSIEAAYDRPSKSDRTPITHLCEAVSSPSADFEYSLWLKTVRKVLSERSEQLFVKAPGKGCAVLRNAIADYLYRYRGMTAEPERIIISSGSEQLYETAVKLLGRDTVYGIEFPSYEQIKAVYGGAGAKILELPMGEDGIESEALSAGGFDVLHVTPFHSYPTGITTSVSKRYEYLKWAETNGKYIIEDDYDSEFFIPGHPIESLYSLSHTQSVIYINTFSKSLSPSMRMGYMILPERLLSEYDCIMGRFSCSVPVLDQYVLAEFISSGSFERHLNRMRRKLRAKQNITHESLDKRQ